MIILILAVWYLDIHWNRVIHVVLGYDGESVYIVTAYYPNTDKFEADLKTRKEQ